MAINVKKTLHKAQTLTKRGDAAAAAQLYRDVLEQYPQNRQAINGLASLNRSNKVMRSASPAPSREQMSQLVALYQRGQFEQARIQAERLASQFSGDPVIHNFLGVVALGLGDVSNAEACYRRAIELHPGYGEAHCNLGISLQQQGRLQDAADSFARATEVEPDNPDAHFGLGNVRRSLGQQQEAISCYQEALKLQPDNADAYNNLGNALHYVGRYREAIEAFKRSQRLKPANAEGHYNLGHAFFELTRYPEAIAEYLAALEIKPELDDARAKLIHCRALICDWSHREEDVALHASLGMGAEAISPFSSLAVDGDPAQQLRRAQHYARQTYGAIEALPSPPPPPGRPEKLRIGYFSADFCNHATMYLMIRLFELHDKERFTVHAYSYGPGHDDEMGQRLKAAVDVFHDVRHIGEQQVAQLARSEQIDIAVDLKGYTQHGRIGIFAHRAAPIQISYLGYPGTLGLPAMDYVLADPVVIPESAKRYYTEQVIYLPHSYQVNDSERVIAEDCPTRTEAGLPESGFVFCCFNNNYKISPAEFDIWMRLLQEVENSVLWMIASSEHVAANLRSEAQLRGVDPERLVIAEKLPLPEHLARHRLADLFLDTFNYNAHTTASDALWAGLPLVTCQGESFAARVGGSLLQAVGLPELITENEEDYESLALALAQDPERLAAIREKLANNRLSAPLFDTATFTRDIESAYDRAYELHLQGQGPESFYVTSGDSDP